MSVEKFKKISRTWWVLAAADGSLLAEGNPNPEYPPYHLDAMLDHMPALVTAPNKFTLYDVRKQWNDTICAYGRGRGRAYYVRGLVHECKVKITIEEAK